MTKSADDHGPTPLYTPAAGKEAAGRLETRLERVERVQLRSTVVPAMLPVFFFGWMEEEVLTG